MKNLPFGIDETMNLRQAARIAFHHGKRIVMKAVPIKKTPKYKSDKPANYADPRCA